MSELSKYKLYYEQSDDELELVKAIRKKLAEVKKFKGLLQRFSAISLLAKRK